MSRELKFRAWDGLVMRYDVTGFEHGTANEMAGVFLNGDFHKIASTPVMQFTGLKDENGDAELYEGDVVQICNTNNAVTEGHTGHISWLWYRWAVVDMEGNSMDLNGCAYTFKRLGNVFENAELLNAEQPANTEAMTETPQVTEAVK